MRSFKTFAIWLSILIPLTSMFPVAVEADGKDFSEQYKLIVDSGISDEFSNIAVKTTRPMPWSVYTDSTYRQLKGKGNDKDSDWYDNHQATVMLMALDDDFRNNAKLVYLASDDVLGLDLEGWYSLKELEAIVYPAIMEASLTSMDEVAGQKLDALVMRGGTVHNTSFEWMLIVPDDVEDGRNWKSVVRAGEPYNAQVNDLKKAYKNGDTAEMKSAAESFAAHLKKSPGQISQSILQLETFTTAVQPFQVALFAYILATLLIIVWLAVRKKQIMWGTVGVTIAGILLHTYGIIARLLISGHFPTTSMYEYLTVFSWAVALFFVIFYFITKQGLVGIVVMPVAFLLIVVSSLFPSQIDDQVVPALQSYWLIIHVSMAAIGEGAFAVAFGAGVLYLLRPLFGPETDDSFLPSRSKLDRIGYAAVSIGYPLFTIGGLIAGAIWAQKAWSVWWSWDPKETASLVVFLVATLYLHARHARGWKGTRTAIIQIIIFITAVLTLFANLVFGGLHSYGV